ncbi:sensor histidine kinase [Sphingomonas carotinifaciens]|uniref:histidine kinase n=1 Tax=Sphingomonas carotinifaciens TaxID=1166323 RepID=A0A1G7M3T5_9SPHN|nr:HAMP domain-containing sensor histidine kinase [Sphingomonas carotinifaciens]MBB4086935.1 two-component system OmpR family sensor kinase [Sphingomonas carotinifaciens]MWC42129.1 HAMP domain-containing protein [Sphingomonas carotinifaciens]SDF56301.1 two-component system, OmpR family, sensor kinase [Sphingomonas carotinifaciens]
MKHRLFWKIWLSYVVAFVALSAASSIIWFRPPEPAQTAYANFMLGQSILSNVADTVRAEGAASARRKIDAWPAEARKLVSIKPQAPGRQCDPFNVKEDLAVSVEGYCLRYRHPPNRIPLTWWSAITDMFYPPKHLFVDLAVGLAFSMMLANYLARSITRLRLGFEQLALGKLDTRLVPSMGRQRNEIADLARDFDAMASRLQALVELRDRLLHDVSHEVRSPLARMRLAGNLLRRNPSRLEASLDRIEAETDRIDRLVGELLTLARLESGSGHQDTEVFDLAAILQLVIADAAFEAFDRGVGVSVVMPVLGPAGCLTRGSGELIHRAIENILRNALKFSQTNQEVKVVLAEDQGRWMMTIEDQGPGIVNLPIADVLQPFVRGTAGTGYGLGLAIAHRAITACGGSLQIENRQPAGLRVALSFPIYSHEL